MKKTLAILALLSLATLPSLADNQRIQPQYRIGTATPKNNAGGRITLLPEETTGLGYATSGGSPCVLTIAKIPAGQEFKKWWYYYYTGNSATVTNTTALGTALTCQWEYNSKITPYSATYIYIVADYDYITYRLNYNGNGSTSGTMTNETYKYTRQFNLTANAFAKTGYSFAGWTNKTGTLFANQKLVSGSSFGVTYTNNTTKTANLYAKWTANAYTVSYALNGGTHGATHPTSATNGTPFAVSAPTRAGYTFAGWTVTSGLDTSTAKWGTSSPPSTAISSPSTKCVNDATGNVYFLNITPTSGGSVTLTANWTCNTYNLTLTKKANISTIYYKVNGASNYSSTTASRTVSVNYGTTWWAYAVAATGYTASVTSDNPASSTMGTSGATFAPTATANTYTVTLNPNYDAAHETNSVQVTYDAAWPALQVPTRDGYRFGGWYTAASGGSLVDTNATYRTAANTTNYAHWVEQVTATFKDGHTGATLKTETLDKGGTPTAPGAPEHEGYYSTGWTPAVGSIFVNTTFTMVYAQYTYTVVFHADNGTGQTASQQFTYNAPAASLNPVSSLSGFSLTGYDFQNWTNSTGTVFADGQQVSNLAQSGEYHLSAVWSPISYAIAFDGNEADGGSVDSIAATYDQTYDLPENGFVKTGRAFKSWRLGLTGETYNVGDSVSNLATTADSVTFYAVWSEPRYIAFDGNGASDAAAMAEDVMTFDGVETKTLVSNKFEKTGYTFVGWATNEITAATLTAAYADGAEVASTNLWMGIGETNIFYAVWQTNTYTVVFNANGGTGTMDPLVLYYDQATNLPERVITPPDASLWAFGGWSNEVDGVVTTYVDRAEVKNLTSENNATVILYAVWRSLLSDLSRAMHCTNLVWEQDDSGREWTIVEGGDKGYDPSGSVVCNQVTWDTPSSAALMPSESSSGSGKLSFYYKMTGDEDSWLEVSKDGKTAVQLDWCADWTQCVVDEIAEINTVQITFSCNRDSADSSTVFIDQMKWVPAGSVVEPTEADKPTISAFMATADGFRLSVDPSNISDSFNYQILATNELVGGDWPVMTNLTSDVIGSGFTIVPEADEPTMFYKVKVIAK